ncbi:histidine phosphatase family protein [Patulibacter brassicae]|uniref:Histidine phosphatase family protein n=1 Tax=Patulibacter brassicae TaxID=1705717 RepID=A0ABU4VKP4_9ACTN|nr:histidine phosphatase family protein [Patulibacter brassicae]MDX8151486.1 histidine phosphatase family protein [Patulibacter brassicae]
MTVRLLLVRHGTTSAVRAAAFPTDEGLDDRGRAELLALAPHLPARVDVRRSPARRCAESVAVLGHDGARVDDALREAGFGDWAGRSLADVHGEDPEAAVAWMTDPAFAPPGGESLEALCARVGGWLGALAADEPTDPVLAITHGGVVRAAIAAAVGAPADAAWRIDVTPGSLTELHAHDGRWRLTRANWTPPRADVRTARGGAATR